LASRQSFGASFQLRRQVIGLGLGGGNLRVGGVVGGGNQNLAEVHLLGHLELLGVGGVVVHLLLVVQVQAAADLFAHHLLGDGLVLDLLFEVFKGDALLAGGLLQCFHAVQMVLLADVVEPADGLGVAGDAELLALGEQELLVDHVAQQGLAAVFEFGLG
jgi:hypothetical protein